MSEFDLFEDLQDAATALLGLGRRTLRRARRLCDLPNKIAEEIRTDIAAVRQRDPAAKSDMEGAAASMMVES